MAIVYRHINKANNKIFYIGIGKADKRAFTRIKRSKFWKTYTSKHDYYVEITHKDVCWEEACSIEKYLISFYGRRDLGLGNLVNMTDGGDGAINLSEDAKKRISESLKNNPSKPYLKLIEFNKTRKRTPCLEETKKKIKDAQIGKIISKETRLKMSQSHKGKVLSEEHKNKLKEASKKSVNKGRFKKGHAMSDETKAKLSELGKRYNSGKFIKGHKMSKETKRKMSQSRSGENHHFFGKSHSEETKRKISETKRLKTQIIEKK